MKYQIEAPDSPRPIIIIGQKFPTHFLDADNQVWWYNAVNKLIYGEFYEKGWYLKEPNWIIGNKAYTFSQLKKAADAPN